MTKWGGWVAALGGLVALVGYYVPSITAWAVPLGGVVALLAGIWAVYEK